MARGRDSDRSAPTEQHQPLLLLKPAPRRPGASLRHLFLQRWPGRLLLGALAARVVLWIAEWTFGASPVLEQLGLVVRIALLVALGYFVWRLVHLLRSRMLWRVRERLLVSYLFIGVVPALLIVTFSVFGVALLLINVGGYLFKSSLDDIVNEMRVAAQAAADEINRGRDPGSAAVVLNRRFENNEGRYPGLSLALLPRSVDAKVGAGPRSAPARVVAGDWSHETAPTEIPSWVSAAGFGGLVKHVPTDGTSNELIVIRAVGFPTLRDPRWGVVIDVPLEEQIFARIYESTGVEPTTDTATRQSLGIFGSGSWFVYPWFVFMDALDWTTGRSDVATLKLKIDIPEIYRRISIAQNRIPLPTANLTAGEFTLGVLAILGVLFLVIEFAAFLMGLTLARSITGSIHALFHGTERVRQGDLAHRIPIRSRDQLGELAESFNAMTSNIEDLLQQAAEKRRLQEELRIAREIQMSLLPRQSLQMPGLAVTAICVPAREVGGDYYDFFRLDEKRVGILIADVAGKGTSAALYMAELKGLVLSLSKIYQSPRQLLIEVNEILSSNLDSRSFITMTYVVIDTNDRSLTYARAGHTPLIHLPSNGQPRRAQVLTPSGMVLGVRIDGAIALFDALLEELTVPLATGDVVVFFTDGITEAMNDASDFFGEDRLTELVEEHAELPSDELRERIVREVEAFVGDAAPHDDMTMILLKVEDPQGINEISASKERMNRESQESRELIP